MQVSMTVNGKRRSAHVEPRLLLVHFLREQLLLTGTHVGCDTSQCGACTVIVDGRSVKPKDHDEKEPKRKMRRPTAAAHLTCYFLVPAIETPEPLKPRPIAATLATPMLTEAKDVVHGAWPHESPMEIEQLPLIDDKPPDAVLLNPPAIEALSPLAVF